MKKIVSIAFLLGMFWAGHAQVATAAAGESATAGNVEVSWTLGELVIETAISDNNTLTQGFHQSKLTVTSVSKLKVSGVELKVYPNPTADYVHIRYGDPTNHIRYALFNTTGKLVKSHTITSDQTRIDMNELPAGIYFLKVMSDKETLQNFKVIKR